MTTASTALRTQSLAKAFGATQALRDCSFELRRGEVHAVLGENGSGKSTLVKILTGVHRPDAGTLEVDGAPRPPYRSPRAALADGIVAVFQEVLTVGPRSVLDNVWLGSEGLLRERLRHGERVRRARAVLDELLPEPPPLNQPVEELSLSQRQACCIARALVREPRVLVLDEATSALDVATRDRLFAMLRRRVADGVSAIFISHRMDEIEEIGDRITVMRSGETVATFERGAATARELVGAMTGAGSLTAGAGEAAIRTAPGPVVLSVRGLRLRPGGAAIDLDLHAGELIGLAGLEGHGQDAFLHALRGAGGVAGEVRAGDASGPLRSPREAARHGIVYVPRERRREGMFETLTVIENFALPTLRGDAAGPIVRDRQTARRFADYVERLTIRTPSGSAPITALSGGNQQKVVISRWLAAEPRILLLNDPTRGIDLGAKRDIYDLLGRLSREGVAVVMLSTEVDELLELMDRVLVFREHELFAELPRRELERERLVGAFFGSDADG
ncbi:MAG TPA: sugar ABC transporter ATP-binding protein [Gaiellaceae bacterium]|nr:sugar ABC transporter ATP-binding protein [Gaiellaceae bacterium]